MNAITLLKKDHRRVERLLERYRGASDREKRAIVVEVTAELTRHMAAEERELYPVLRQAIPDGRALVADAVREHQEARGLLAELVSLGSGGFERDAKVATLRQSVAHHVADEESEVFPRMVTSLDPKRIEGLGPRIERAKKSSPTRPARADAAKSPGASVGGMVAAASDRVAQLLSLSERGQMRSHVASPKSRPRRSKPGVKPRKPATPRRRAHK